MDRRGSGAKQMKTDEWSEHISTSGKKYYFNSRTKESQWVIPTDALRKYKEEQLNSDQYHTPVRSRQKEGLLATPYSRSNGTASTTSNNNYRSNGPSYTTPKSTPQSTHNSHTNSTPQNSHNNSHLPHTPVNSSHVVTPTRHSLDRRTPRTDHYKSIQRTPTTKSDSRTSSPTRLGKNTPQRVQSTPDPQSQPLTPVIEEDLLRTKFLDPLSVSLLVNSPAESLERQAKQSHEEALKCLDVELPRTITDCAHLRAVLNVRNLQSSVIEHRLELLRKHIEWLVEGSDFTYDS